MTGIAGDLNGWRGRLNRVSQGGTLPRAALVVGIGTTVALNVTAGIREGRLGGALVAALMPVALLISLETLIWLARSIGWKDWRWAWQLAAGLPLLGVAAITGVVSYLHALTVAEWTGSTGAPAHLIPLVPDQLIVTGSVALMAIAVTRTPSRVKTEIPATRPAGVKASPPAKRARPATRRPGPGRPPVEITLPDGALAAAAADPKVHGRNFQPWLAENYGTQIGISRYKADELLKTARANGHNHTGEA